MGKNQSASNLPNIVLYDTNGNLSFVSGSTTLLSVSSSGALTTNSTITARTLVVQTITSSTDFITGSAKFGTTSANTFQFTGSIAITGSIYVGGSMGTAMNSIYTASNNMVYIQSTINGIQQANTNTVNSGSIVLTNTGGTGAYSIIAHGGSTAGNGLFIQAQDRTATTYYPILLNPNGGNIGIGISSPGGALHIVSAATTRYGTSDGPTAGYCYYDYRYNGTIYGYLGQAASIVGGGSNTDMALVSINNLVFGAGGTTERMRITNAGNVGIAGTAGSGRLQVWGEDQSGSNFSLTTYNSGGFGMFFVRNDGNIRTNSGMYGNTTSGTTRSVFVGNGDYYLGGISSIRASKKNIENISNIDWIHQLTPVTFNYRKKDEEGNYTEDVYDELNYGLIAEDTAPIADFLINYNDKEDGTKEMIGIEYMRLIIPMLKAIQELKAEIDELKNNK